MNTEETPLANRGSGAAAAKAHRRQDVVLHTAGPWSRSVMALLKHLEAVGFEGAPPPGEPAARHGCCGTGRFWSVH